MGKKFEIASMSNSVDVEGIKNAKGKSYIKNSLKQENEVVVPTKLELIHDFPDHPFNIGEDSAEMQSLIESVRVNGVLQPVILTIWEDECICVAGHRRRFAANAVGLSEIPSIYREYESKEAIIIAMIESNFQREKISHSEKAKAYYMRYMAMKRQGKRTDLTLRQNVSKLTDEDANSTLRQNVSKLPNGRTTAQIGIGWGDNYKTVERYIQIYEFLIKPLKEMLNNENLPFIVAVDISYLDVGEQDAILNYLKQGKKLNTKKSAEIRQLKRSGGLTADTIDRIFNPYKPPRESVELKFEPPQSPLNTSSTSVELKSVPPANESSADTQESLQLRSVPHENEASEKSNAPFMQLNIDGEEVPPQTKKEAISELVSKLKKKHGVSEISNWAGEENQVMKGYLMKAFDLWNEEKPSEQISEAVLDHLLSALRWATDDMTAEEAFSYYERRK